MKKKIIIFVIICIIGIAGFMLYNNSQKAKATSAPPLTKVAVDKGDISIDYSDSGSSNLNIVGMGFATAGNVDKINVTENQKVTKGTLLMSIKNKDYESTLAKSENAYQTSVLQNQKNTYDAANSLIDAKNAVTTSKNQLDIEKAKYEDLLNKYKVVNGDFNTVQVDDSPFKKVEMEYNAMKDIANGYSENELLSKKLDYENAKETYENSKSSAVGELMAEKISLDNASSQYEKSLRDYTNLTQKNYDKSLDELSIQKSSMDYADAKAKMDDTKIYAPYDLEVLSVDVKLGDDVTSGQVVMNIRKQENILVVSNIAETDLANITAGMEVEVNFQSNCDKTYTGKVTKISNVPTVSNNVVSYTVESTLDSNEPDIKDKMSCDIKFIIKQKKDCFKIPNKAVYINDNDGNQYVKVINKNIQEERKIVTGFTDGTESEVISGLSAGDVVVYEGTQAVSASSTKSSSNAGSLSGNTNFSGFGGGRQD